MKKKIFVLVALLTAAVSGFAWEVRVGKDTVFTDVKTVYVISGINPAGGIAEKGSLEAPPVYQVELKDGTVWTFCGSSGFFTNAPIKYTPVKPKQNK